MSGHTPGSWTIGNESDACCDVEAGPSVIMLDRMDRHECRQVISRAEMLANARLIAAAPALLAALEELTAASVLSSSAEWDKAWDAARAAIALARGGR